MQRLIGTVLLATAIAATPVASVMTLAQTTPAETAPAQQQPSPSGAHGGAAAAPAAPTAAPSTPAPTGQTAPISPGNAVSAPAASSQAAPAVTPGAGASQTAGPATAPTPPSIAGQATLPHDLSPWGMFMAADIVVKAVMLGLAFASLVTWTIWLAKAMELVLEDYKLVGQSKIISVSGTESVEYYSRFRFVTSQFSALARQRSIVGIRGGAIFTFNFFDYPEIGVDGQADFSSIVRSVTYA